MLLYSNDVMYTFKFFFVAKKPGKDELAPMYDFLRKKYLEKASIVVLISNLFFHFCKICACCVE